MLDPETDTDLWFVQCTQSIRVSLVLDVSYLFCIKLVNDLFNLCELGSYISVTSIIIQNYFAYIQYHSSWVQIFFL